MEAVAIMREQKISFLSIAVDRKPVGVLSERDVVRLACEHINSASLHIKDVMTSPVITVDETENILQVYDRLSSKKIRHLVVVDYEGLISGVVTLTNILGGLSIEYFIELKQVANIMTQQICTLNTNDSVQQALEIMATKRISCVVIVSRMKPVGIFTERDVTRLYGSGLNEKATVDSIMSSPVRTIDVTTFIPQANAIMRDEHLRHLVVVDNSGALVGLLSQSDIARRIEDHYVDYLRSLVLEKNQELQYEHARFDIIFKGNPNSTLSPTL